MKKLYLTIDTLSFDLPNEFVASSKRYVTIRDVIVTPKLSGDYYILQGNFVENVVSTDSSITQNFICVCNDDFLQRKRYQITNNIRQISFNFITLSGANIPSETLKFIIDLELEYTN